MNKYKKRAIHISEDLKGVNTQDNVIHNVEQVCDYVIDILESVVGSESIRTKFQNDVVKEWKLIKKQAKNIYT